MNCSIEGCEYTCKRIVRGMCFNHYEQQYEKEHPEYVAKKRERTNAYWQIPSNKDRAKINRSKPKARFISLIRAAAIRGKEITITFEQWCELVLNKKCEYCGGELPVEGTAEIE